jgi:hypothetical protein
VTDRPLRAVPPSRKPRRSKDDRTLDAIRAFSSALPDWMHHGKPGAFLRLDWHTRDIQRKAAEQDGAG